MTAVEGTADAGRLTIAQKRYELLMLSYPPSWRRDNAEALLGTCLDAAAGRRGGGPTLREALDLLFHGLTWRLRLLWPSDQTRRLAAALALVLGTAIAMTCFIAAEWQPGVAPRGWRIEPGHVGPFATLGPVIYAGWAAALLATLAGRAVVARRLLLGSIGAALVTNGASLMFFLVWMTTGRAIAHPIGGLFGLRRPPAAVIVLLISLALLGCLGRLAWRARERWLIGMATVVLTGLMLMMTRPAKSSRIWHLDQAFAFYRSSSSSGYHDLIRFQTHQVIPLIVLAAALAWRWHPEWLPATLILSLVSDPIFRLPDAYFANVDVFWTRAVGRSMYSDFNYDMLTTPLILVALMAAIWWRWRSGRPSAAMPQG